jgi:DNA-binding NarL/FixJ family response regulator
MKVLIVDDHAMFGEAIRVLLEGQEDVEAVDVVSSGEDAIEAAAALQPDVVLMDVNLPGINGIDATRALLERTPTASVVVISSLHDATLMARAVEAGASGFVAKTRAADELIDVVKAAAQGEMVLPESRAKDILKELQGLRRTPNRSAPTVSTRELEVLQAFADGLSTAEVAARLFITERTVQSHIRSILSKLEMSSKLQAVLWALRQGKIQLRAGPAPDTR